MSLSRKRWSRDQLDAGGPRRLSADTLNLICCDTLPLQTPLLAGQETIWREQISVFKLNKDQSIDDWLTGNMFSQIDKIARYRLTCHGMHVPATEAFPAFSSRNRAVMQKTDAYH